MKPDEDITKDGNFFSNEYDLKMAQGVSRFIFGISEPEGNSYHFILSICMNDLQINGKSEKAERLQTSSEMSYSLSIAFLFILLMKLISFLKIKILEMDVIAVICLGALSLLFYYRGWRMRKYYVRCLVRSYALLHKIV